METVVQNIQPVPYTTLIERALDEKMRKNPSLSLRSFSKKCGISVASLSRYLSGQRKLTTASALKIAHSLQWSPQETEHILDLISWERAKSSSEKERLLKKLALTERRSIQAIPLDIFRVISEWHHFAILSLTNTRSFQSNPALIARRLGIKVIQASVGLDNLIKVGLLRKSSNGQLEEQTASLETPPDIASAASREHHRQHLQKAGEALDELAVEFREFINLTLNMNSKDIPKAKKVIRSFVDQFERSLETKPSDQVFQLNVQLYPLTKMET